MGFLVVKMKELDNEDWVETGENNTVHEMLRG